MLTVLLGSSLKFDGRFILQTQTDGPVACWSWISPTGEVRACMPVSTPPVAAVIPAGDPDGGALLRPGPPRHDHRPGAWHQPLSGPRSARRRHAGGGRPHQCASAPSSPDAGPARGRRGIPSPARRRRTWRAGGLLVQFLPTCRSGARARLIFIPATRPRAPRSHTAAEDDAWVEAHALVETVEDHELVDPAVSVEHLVYRLFHERGVRVFVPSSSRPVLVSRAPMSGHARGLRPGSPRPWQTAPSPSPASSAARTINLRRKRSGRRRTEGRPSDTRARSAFGPKRTNITDIATAVEFFASVRIRYRLVAMSMHSSTPDKITSLARMVRRDITRETSRQTLQPTFGPYLETRLRRLMVGEVATSSARA